MVYKVLSMYIYIYIYMCVCFINFINGIYTYIVL